MDKHGEHTLNNAWLVEPKFGLKYGQAQISNIKGVVHVQKKPFAANLLTPMSSKISMSFFLQSKRN